jgi:hypothetical protein
MDYRKQKKMIRSSPSSSNYFSELMTQAINKPVIEENNLLDKFRNLTPEQQQSIVNSVEFMDWTVRSSRKINEFTRVSAPNALQTSSRLIIAERLSKQGF